MHLPPLRRARTARVPSFVVAPRAAAAVGIAFAMAVTLANPSRASAQLTSFPSSATVSYTMHAVLGQGGQTPQVLDDSKSLSTSNPYADPARLNGSLTGTFASADAASSLFANASLIAGAGLMRIGVSGSTSASWAAGSRTSSANMSNTFLNLNWQDFYLVQGNPSDPQPGRPLFINATLRVDGNLTFAGVPDAVDPVDYFSAAFYQLTLSGTDDFGRNLIQSSARGQESQNTIPGSAAVDQSLPQFITVQFQAFENRVGFMNFSAELRPEAFSGAPFSTLSPSAGSTSGTFDIDFTHTVSWGGITSIVDATTGEPVTGWSVISASGVNYANPVPEPALGLAPALATFVLTRGRRSRRSRHITAAICPSRPSA